MSAGQEHQFTVNNAFTKGVYRDVYPAVDPKAPENSQKGKVVLITGASRGIGKHGISEAFAFAGARAIIITARNIDSLKETEANIKKANPSTEVLPLALEVSDESSITAAFKKIGENYSSIDVLVNNAGSFQSNNEFVASPDTQKWWIDFEINVKGAMLVTKHFLTFLKEHSQKTAHIVYLSSAAGLFVIPGISSYSITKLADLQLTAYVAAENPDVTAIAVHPGIVATDMATDMFKPFAKDTPALAGAVINWASTGQADFLSARYISVNWDVNELKARKEEIKEKNLLSLALTGLNGQTAELLG